VEIGERRDGDILILSPAGRIDNDTSQSFQTRLLSALTRGGAAVLPNEARKQDLSSAFQRLRVTTSNAATPS